MKWRGCGAMINVVGWKWGGNGVEMKWDGMGCDGVGWDMGYGMELGGVFSNCVVVCLVME